MVALRHDHSAEAEQWDRLRERGFTGREFDAVTIELTRYAIRELSELIKTRKIVLRCRRLGRPIPGVLPTAWHDVQEVVHDTVADGLRLFRQSAVQGIGWSPSGGASMRAYFLNTCLLGFSNAHRKWLRYSEGQRQEVALAELPEPLVADHAEEIAARDGVLNLVNELSDRERKIAFLLSAGLSRGEVAEIIGTSRRGVDGIIQRLRQRLRRHHGDI